jgi:hypothetical protein
MYIRPGKLLLIALVPVALYGAAKGLMYYKAKTAVDDIVVAAANQAEIRYSGISTDIRGAVTVEGLTVTPRGYDTGIGIDAVRVTSDDPMFFIANWDWQPASSEPPPHLGIHVSGLRMPLDSAFVADVVAAQVAAGEGADLCLDGPNLEPSTLRRLGYDELVADFGGQYRLDKTNLSLDASWEMVVQDLQSMEFSVEMSDVDVGTLKQGAPPQFNLAGMRLAIDVAPEFGRRTVEACASDGQLNAAELSARFADRFIERAAADGVSLGTGLQNAVRTFYKDWGRVEVVAVPPEPVGLLSMMVLPPERLVDALSLRLSVNDQLVTDTRFRWDRPETPALSKLFGTEPAEPAASANKEPRRVVVRREYEPVAAGRLSAYLDHEVRIQPKGQPMREGELLAIRNGIAEVEQTLHGGKFTVYVPVKDIASAQVLIQREVKQLP